MRILIKNALIVNEGSQFNGSLLIENGKISEIFKSSDSLDIAKVDKEIDASGKLLLPGIIDDQVHFRDPGLTHKGDFYSESRAAVAGGITSVMEMPNTNPQTTTKKQLDEKLKMASEKSFTNYSFYFGATNDNINEILNIDESKICGLKVFMGSSTGNMLVDDPTSLEKIFSSFKGLVAVHCEDEGTIRRNTELFKQKYGEAIPIKSHPEIRSEEACYLSSSLAVKLAKRHNTRLHILHLSTAKELELLQSDIPSSEKRITAEVCVHHLWFDENDYEEKGTYIKWNPAIKKPTDREALLNAVNEDKIDIIATDHAPHTLEEKNNPYLKAPSGGPLVQHSLVAMLELNRKGKISLEKIVEKMCHAPADLFHIKNRGYIRKGYWADLVLIEPDSAWEVNTDNILYKCGWSPFDGQVFHSKVFSTIINGHLVYHNNKIDESHRGLPLKFQHV